MNKKKLIKAINSVDVESDTSNNISIAMSSNASVYQDINTRLYRAYGNDK
jgi:hypothetical protein